MTIELLHVILLAGRFLRHNAIKEAEIHNALEALKVDETGIFLLNKLPPLDESEL